MSFGVFFGVLSVSFLALFLSFFFYLVSVSFLAFIRCLCWRCFGILFDVFVEVISVSFLASFPSFLLLSFGVFLGCCFGVFCGVVSVSLLATEIVSCIVSTESTRGTVTCRFSQNGNTVTTCFSFR